MVFLGNHVADKNDILCGAFLGSGIDILFTISWSNDKPKYGKNASKIFFSGIDGQIYSKFGMFHWGLQPIIVCSYDDLWMTLTYFTARSILETKAFRWKKAKTMDILETVAAWDLKVARCRQLMEPMKVCNLLRPRSFLDLDPRSPC